MRSSRTRCASFIFSVLLIAMAASANAQTITTIDVTGAGTFDSQGSRPGAINTAGVIAGYYIDSGGVYHGFVRSAGGTITTFDAPGAGSEIEGGTLNEGGINDSGTIAGPYSDSGLVYHGLVRSASGTITSFDITDAGTGANQGTIPHWINTAGSIAGRYADSGGVFHGFVRSSGGTVTTFDVTGAGTAKQEGTYADGINDSGVIGGFYIDQGGVAHGYLRAANGTITPFDVPGGGTGLVQGTVGSVLDTAGDAAGNVIDSSGVNHGFLRLASGTITVFDVTGAGTSKGQGTLVGGISPSGIIVGQVVDSGGVSHGYVRAVDGTITVIDVPGAGSAIDEGTLADGINASGEIVGHYIDSGGVLHGFIRSGSTGTSQTINFTNPGTQTYGVGSIALSATASSGLAVSFAVTAGPAIVTGSSLTITGAGSVTVQATQAGNGTYAAAAPVNQTFAVDPALLTAVGNNASVASGAAIPALTGTLTGVVAGDGITASYSTTAVTGSPVGTYAVTPVLHDPNGKLGNYSLTLGNGTLTIYSVSGLPLVLWLSPAGAIEGGASYTLTVNGGNFTSSSRVLWNGALLTTTPGTSSQLTATVPAADILNEGTALVTVANAAATSSGIPVAVVSANPVAKITAASLSDAADGSGNHVLTLTGTGLVSNSKVQWNGVTGSSLVTEYESPWQISALVTAPEYTSRPATVTVINSAGTSEGLEVQ